MVKSEENITHAIAIEWVRINFGYYIGIYLLSDKAYYYYTIQTIDGEYVKIGKEFLKTPQQVTEAALLFTLKQLIK